MKYTCNLGKNKMKRGNSSTKVFQKKRKKRAASCNTAKVGELEEWKFALCRDSKTSSYFSFPLRVSEYALRENGTRKGEKFSSFFLDSTVPAGSRTRQKHPITHNREVDCSRCRHSIFRQNGNAPVAVCYRSSRVTHFISIYRGAGRLWPVLSRWQNRW